MDLTWETTEEDGDGDFVMVAFSGAADADNCSKWAEKKRKTKYIQALRHTYPGVGKGNSGSEVHELATRSVDQSLVLLSPD